MAAANFSRDEVIIPVKTTKHAIIIMSDFLEDTPTGDLNDFETVFENMPPARGDLIDLETVLENPPFSIEWNHVLGTYQPLGKQKLHNHCDWLKIGKNERCGKCCKQFYCSTHSNYIKKGVTMPLPCLCCGVGVRRSNQLCKRCEMKYGVEYK